MSKKKSRKQQPAKAKQQKKIKAKTQPTEKQVWIDHTDPKDDFYRKIFLGLSGFVLLVMIILSFSAGINADDSYQVKYSENVVNFYTTFGEDRSALENVRIGNSEAPMQNYGGFYELMAGGVNRILGYEEREPGYHNVRQMLIALFGFVAMFFTALL
jgi:hypothetical protein